MLDNNGWIGVEVPVSGASGSIRAVDLSDLQSVGAFLDGAGHALSVTGSAEADTLSLWSLDDTVHAGSGDDAVFGGYGDDRLYGELGDDQLNGGDGNDRFQGSKGNDTIDGGAGDDIALYSGKASDYHVAIVNGLWQVADLRAGSHDGIDLVGNVEHLQFSDRTIDLQGGGASPHG